MFNKVTLCEPPETCCPDIEVHADGRVTIGEFDKVAELTHRQWNILVRMVKDGTLTEIA